jgi:hypothetical protein
MIIVDPVVLGDVPFTRASPKWVYDRTGTLVEVPANTVGVTYDPADLSKAPWALVEPAAPQLLRYTEELNNGAAYGGSQFTIAANAATAPSGAMAADRMAASADTAFHYLDQEVFGRSYVDGEKYTFSVFARADTISRIRLDFYYSIGGTGGFVAAFNLATGTIDGGDAYIESRGAKIQALPGGWFRCSMVGIVSQATAYPSKLLCRVVLLDANGNGSYAGVNAPGAFMWGWNLTPGDKLSSYISSGATPLTRAADVVGAGAGLVYSNVPMVEPPYNAATTYAKDAAVYDPTTKIVYWSMVAGNVGKALSDPAFWNKRTAINRWAMFDDRNSTQTSNPEEIVSVFSAQAITQGLFAGAMDASEVRVSMTHPTRGLVYSETKSLVLPRSGSSFFGWCFNRLRLRTWFLTLKLPVFANALVTVTIKKPGGVPKCGMCLLGPTVDVGLSLMGLSTELKDYSTTTFFTDGSSSTVERGFSKKMSVDISVESDRVETIEDDLIKRRQKTLVFLGSTMRGDTMLVGRFSSLRKVIDSFPRSKMALQIDGVLSQ